MSPPSLAWIAGYAATAADLGAAGIGIHRRRRLTRGQRLMVVWLTVSGLSDVLALTSARLWHTSRPIARVWYLLGVVLALEALASFQYSLSRVLMFRIAASCYAVIWVALLVTIEPMSRYAPFTASLHGILILAAASVTVLRRVAQGRRDLLVDPGFLIGIGLTAYAVPAAVQSLVATLSVTSSPQHAKLFYAMANTASVMAVLIFVRALMIDHAPARASRG